MADLHSYQPNRFISEEKNQLDVRGQHFHLLPFGSGRRGCPGTSLALQVVQTTLATLIQCFKWKANGEERTVDMEEGPRLTLPRAHPLISVPVTRLSTRLDSTEFDVYDKAISEQSIEEEEIKDPTAISKTMSCRKPIKHKNTLMSNGVVSH